MTAVDSTSKKHAARRSRIFSIVLSALTLALSGAGLNQAINHAYAAPITANALTPTADQQLVTKQMAQLMDRQHYLNMPLDANTSKRVLAMYIDSLDSEHTLFLQQDVDEFTQKYAATLGDSLKAGDLNPAFEIYQRYLKRINEFHQAMLADLNVPQDLNGTGTIDTDREKAPFFKSSAEQRDYWHKQLISQLISLTITRQEEQAKQAALKANPALANGQDLSTSELTPVETLKKRYKRQMEQVSRVKSDKVLEAILNAALATYDPHSNYFAPIEAMEMNRQTTLALEGIGVSIRPERGNEDYTRIETIVEGGPAAKSGQIHAGDRIIAVAQDGGPMVDVVGWSSSEIVALIRGARGTKVTLRVQAKGGSPRQVPLVRDVIQEDDAGVQTRIIEEQHNGKTYRMGVLDIPSFYLNYRARREGANYRSVFDDTQKAINHLNAQHIDGLVVDLRANPGGSLEDVAKMLGLFIKQGPLVQIRDGNGAVNVYRDLDGGAQDYSGPLAVLINLASASASEIFSAAIQDYQRGIILGSTTTGKGTAQVQLDSLAYGQATLTQRKFYRVTGGSTQNKGVVPDIPLVSVYDEDDFGERKAKNALAWDTIKTAPYQRDQDLSPLLPELLAQSEQRQKINPQFNFLREVKRLSEANKNRKVLSLNLNTRLQEIQKTEAQTLAAENTRRVQTGLAPYATWDIYQTALDAQSEARAKMKATERPKLPEDEAYVHEANQVLIDYMQKTLQAH